MRILHTSDWHLGRLLYNQQRYSEFEAFLNWLLDIITGNNVELLLVAGDIFDTTTPGNRALNLYYDFLYRVSLTCCRNVVIVGGNHDSPAVLNAPSAVLKVLNVHVIGEMTSEPERELLLINDDRGSLQAIVCAVPFLRDRDVRSVVSGDDVISRQDQLRSGIIAHYNLLAARADALRAESAVDVPILATGHLFTRSERSEEYEGEGVRDLYVGSLAYIDAADFSSIFDYVALGHIHRSQRIGGSEIIRYSGSPLPMGFREALYSKKVLLLTTNNRKVSVSELDVPVFQTLLRIEGDFTGITEELMRLKAAGSNAWLELELTSDELRPSFSEEIQEMLVGTEMKALKIKNRNFAANVLQTNEEIRSLDDLTVEEIFINCLNDNDVADEERPGLIESFREILAELQLTETID